MFAGPLEGSPTFYGAQTVSIAHNNDGAEARARHPETWPSRLVRITHLTRSHTVPDYERISITIEPDLLRRLDGHIAAHGHANRSEAVRDLIRNLLVEGARADGPVAGSLTLVYDHRQRALSERLVDVAHHHHGIVLSTLHVHLDHDTCMEISALQGQRSELQHYAGHVLGMKGVLHGTLVISCERA